VTTEDFQNIIIKEKDKELAEEKEENEIIEDNEVKEGIEPVKKIQKEMSRQTEDAILRKLATCYTSTDGRDLYLFFQVVQIFRGHYGDEPLKKYYGEKYDVVMGEFRRLGYYISKLGMYLGSIQKLDNPHFYQILDFVENNPKFKQYSEIFAKISLNMHLLYEIFTVLLNESPKLKMYNIPSYYWIASGVIEPQLLYKIQQQLKTERQYQGAMPNLNPPISFVNEETYR
jgi:hypothetical protein